MSSDCIPEQASSLPILTGLGRARRLVAMVMMLFSAFSMGGCGGGSAGEGAIRDTGLFPEWISQAVNDMEGQCPPGGGGAQVTLAVEVPADARPDWAAVEAAHGPMEGGEGPVRYSGGLGFRLDEHKRVEAVVVNCGRLRAADTLAGASRSQGVPLSPELEGTWLQEPVADLGRAALRFAEMGGAAVVFIAPSFDPDDAEPFWEGPFPLQVDREGTYKIDVQLGSLSEHRTRMFMDQHGRTLVAESTHLLGKGEVGLRHEEDGRLIASSLWIHSKWERWDDEGVPIEGQSKPLEVVYRRSSD